MVIGLAFTGGYALHDWRGSAANDPQRGTVSPAATPGAGLLSGEELSRAYCGACHLYPEPGLLTKREWIHHVLPQVALRVGIEPANYDSLQDGKILQAAGLFPSEPMLSEADWFAIWDYYKATAPETPLPPPDQPGARSELPQFRARKVNFHQGMPMISLVKVDPAQQRLYVGDAYMGMVAELNPAGDVLRTVKLGSPPVSLSRPGAGLLVTLIGRFFPSDVLEGSVVLFPGDLEASPLPLVEQLRRPTDAVLADLDQDGRDDLAVCAFGNRLGQFAWYRNAGGGQWEENVLLDRPGATRCQVADLNRDGRPDLLVLTGQAREGVVLFENQGAGRFTVDTLLELPPTHGLVDFQLVDFNRDGHLDLLTANGDNGDLPTPHKSYHGLRLFLNDGRQQFQPAWFYPLAGAYKAIAADFDDDGDLDIAAISFYPDFSRQPLESFVYLENRGPFQFAPATFAESQAGRWMVMDAGDVDGDGDTDLALGSFVVGPTTLAVPADTKDYWKTNGAAVLILENVLRTP